ncbi:cytochrome P450 CYP82D47-like [Iris pallida]|uniref:Cytochrome P450 CYP82D47-like n=1 Tax=Iris pallida TaxID=29817 RepID=A0AAX6I3P7_IRIPA|nr:cytochrome P450 CYP82D47-like [Iris pallida]
MDILLQLQYICGLIFLAIFCKEWARRMLGKKNAARSRETPQPPGALPVIGHLRLLSGPKPLPQKLADMADEHGPTFALRLGTRRLLVVSSYEGVRDCFTTNDRALASRPSYAAGKHMGYGFAMVGFAPYGAYWRSLRRITTVELLSNARLETLKHVWSAEIGLGVKELHRLWADNSKKPIKVDIKRWLGDLTYNTVVTVVAGKRYFGSGRDGRDEAEAWRFRNAVARFFKLLTAFVVSDMFPFLKGLDLNGNVAAMKAAAGDLDVLLTSLLEEHRRRKLSEKDYADQDFMDMMITTLDQDAEFSEFDADKVIKATSLAMIFGGTDNTTNSMALTLAALLSNPDVLKRVQDELGIHVGENRVVESSDIENLTYLRAVVKEAFRLYPSAQLNVPHEATEECEIQGFRVPAGTQVIVNIWKLHRDPRVWPDPLEFRPERFMSGSNVDVRGQHFELIPFGSGRRACPGISFSLQVIQLTLARLVQGFELKVPAGDASAEAVRRYLAPDNQNATQLEIELVPRLATSLYT